MSESNPPFDPVEINHWWGLPIELETLLVFFIFFAGIAWLSSGWIKKPRFTRMTRMAFWLLCVALLVRSWGYEHFTVPTGSMVPLIRIHDTVWVNKHAYGLRWPVVKTWMRPPRLPDRADVVVFFTTPEEKNRMVKRVMGLPGDEILWLEGSFWINGRQLQQQQEKPVALHWQGLEGSVDWKVRQEAYADQAYEVIAWPELPRSQQKPRLWRVPQGHLFVMGDNRPLSEDSRAWGFVSVDRLIGRVSAISTAHPDPDRTRWTRVGSIDSKD